MKDNHVEAASANGVDIGAVAKQLAVRVVGPMISG
jgi:hypothetical protein